MKYIKIDNRKIIIKGIGKAFYQDGYPIPLSVNQAKEQGFEVSYLHLCDELLNEWQTKTVINKLRSEFQDSIIGDEKVNFEQIELFCNSAYEDQREMIFNYLFGYSTDSIRSGDNPIPYLINQTTS